LPKAADVCTSHTTSDTKQQEAHSPVQKTAISQRMDH
jgi:hypothetical protein